MLRRSNPLKYSFGFKTCLEQTIKGKPFIISMYVIVRRYNTDSRVHRLLTYIKEGIYECFIRFVSISRSYFISKMLL